MSSRDQQARDSLACDVTSVFSPVISPCDQASRRKFPHLGVSPRQGTVGQRCWPTLHRVSPSCNGPSPMILSAGRRSVGSLTNHRVSTPMRCLLCPLLYFDSRSPVRIFYGVRFRVQTFKKKGNTMLTVILCVVVIIEIQTAFRRPRLHYSLLSTAEEDTGRTNESGTRYKSAFEYDNNGCYITE